MLSIPEEIPVTRPPETVAFAFTALHIPPLAVSLRVIVEPKQRFAAPDIVPTKGVGITVISNVHDIEGQYIEDAKEYEIEVEPRDKAVT